MGNLIQDIESKISYLEMLAKVIEYVESLETDLQDKINRTTSYLGEWTADELNDSERYEHIAQMSLDIEATKKFFKFQESLDSLDRIKSLLGELI